MDGIPGPQDNLVVGGGQADPAPGDGEKLFGVLEMRFAVEPAPRVEVDLVELNIFFHGQR